MLDWQKCSNDPMPMKVVRLSEAFERVQAALRAKPQVLQTLDPSLRDYLIQNRNKRSGATYGSSHRAKA